MRFRLAIAFLGALILGTFFLLPAGKAVAAGKRVAIQAGHWRASEAPPPRNLETGGSVAGVDEWAVDLDVAQRVAILMGAAGYEAQVLPAWFSEGYAADVFVALHVNGSIDPTQRGFFADRAGDSVIPDEENRLVRQLNRSFADGTAIPYVYRPTRASRAYYAFYRVSAYTPSAIIEMGFLTNPTDRAYLTSSRQIVAQALANALTAFLQGGSVPPDRILKPDAGTIPPGAPLADAPVLPGSANSGSSRYVVNGTGSCLRVRATPSASALVVDCLADGTVLTVTDEQTQEGRDWRRTSDGWVAAEFLSAATSAAPPTPAGPVVATVSTEDGCLRVRAEPGLAAVVINCLPDGASVSVLSDRVPSDGFTWARLADQGWVAAEFLDGV